METAHPAARSKRAQKRAEMLRAISAAYEQLDDEQMPETQLDRLVEQAGIARSTFYVYFPDRVDLYIALTTAAFEELTTAGAYWWSIGERPTLEGLREAIEHLVDAYRSRRLTVGAILDAASRHTAVQLALRAEIGRFVEALSEHIVSGQRGGTISAELDPTPTATWLAWMLERSMSELVGPADVSETDRLVSTITSLVWNVLYARPTAPLEGP